MTTMMSTTNLPGKPTIAAKVEAKLRHDILHGLIRPGARLNLDALRAEMGVGLTPLREAVMRLVSDGLIEAEPQKGYSVTPISTANLDEVSALRLEIEPYALRRSIANGGLDWETSVMAALYRLNRTERAPGDAKSLADWEAANNNFHFALIARCDMPLLIKIYRSLVSLNDRYRNIYLKAAGVQREVIEEHSAIAAAAVERDPDEASELLSEHIRRSTENLRRLIAADLPEAHR